MLTSRAKKAIDHAQRTTGTLQWCTVGVFSGDGKLGLDPAVRRSEPSYDVVFFLERRCSPFTQPELLCAADRQMQRSRRYQALAKKAIDKCKWESAISLVNDAKSAHDKAQEIRSGNCMLYHLPNSRAEVL